MVAPSACWLTLGTAQLQDAIARFVYTTLEPLLKPVMGQATQVLSQGSAQVINQADQYEVFDKPYATDPTHSFLSKGARLALAHLSCHRC